MVVRGGQNFWPSGGGENFFANLGGGDGFFDPKGGVKRTLLRGELKIVQQRGAKLPPGRTLNRGVQMKKNFVGGGKKISPMASLALVHVCNLSVLKTQ